MATNCDPNHSDGWYQRGKCYMQLNDFKRALYDFSAAIRAETKSNNTIPSDLATYYMHAGMCNQLLG